MNITNCYTLILEHCKNPDIAHDERRGYWQPPQSPRKQRVQCDDLPQARDKFLAWILRNGLGAGNLTRMCGTVLDGKIKVGQFSYNGTLWDDAGNQITGFNKAAAPAASVPASTPKNPLLQSLIWCVVALETPEKMTPEKRAEILEQANAVILANA